MLRDNEGPVIDQRCPFSPGRTVEEQLEASRALSEKLLKERDQAAARIQAMESTKFWKLRRKWFLLRQFVGLPGPE
jgi:hypothetical protein